MSPFLERVNRTKVTADLLGDVLKMHAAMAPEDRAVLEVRFIRLLELLDKKGLGRGRRRAALATAIEFRLEALAGLESDHALRAWIMPGEELGCDYVHAELLEAAAKE
ncbi:MAG TPA: hypothetical protein VGC27_00955, partial [Rhizomicrobium sp.]